MDDVYAWPTAVQRGPKIDKNVYREVINHRKLSHPNIIGFKSVHIDNRYLYIVMEYGAGAIRQFYG